jgi:hypothetical protein
LILGHRTDSNDLTALSPTIRQDLIVDTDGKVNIGTAVYFSPTNFASTYPGLTISNSAVPNIRMFGNTSSAGEGPAIFFGDSTNNERWQYFMLADAKAFTFLNRITDGSGSNFGHALYIDTANRVAIGAAASGTGYNSLTLTDQFLVNVRVNTYKGIVIKGAASQSGNLLETQSSGGTAQLAIASNGRDFILDTTTGTKIGTSTSQKLGFYNATPVVQPSAYTITNPTATRSLDEASTTLTTVAQVLGTLIKDLQSLGLVG